MNFMIPELVDFNPNKTIGTQAEDSLVFAKKSNLNKENCRE